MSARTSEFVVWIASSAAKKLVREAHDKYPYETGGLLIGYESEDGRESVVTTVVGPGLKAKHDRYNFVPDVAYHQRAAAEIYRSSGKRLTYLGDWHTHPRGSPQLSSQDARTLRRIARDQAQRLKNALMGILAVDPKRELFAVHVARRSERRFLRAVSLTTAELREFSRRVATPSV